MKRSGRAYTTIVVAIGHPDGMEMEYEIDAEVTPYVPARITADPYHSYPAEGPDVEIHYVRRADGKPMGYAEERQVDIWLDLHEDYIMECFLDKLKSDGREWKTERHLSRL